MGGPDVRVLLVSSNEVERDLLKRGLELEPGIRVVGEARDGLETLGQFDALLPDIVVLDFGLPDTNGIELTEQLLAHHPDAQVVLLTSRAFAGEYAKAALMAGALDILPKPSEMGMLAASVRFLTTRARKPPRLLR